MSAQTIAPRALGFGRSIALYALPFVALVVVWIAAKALFGLSDDVVVSPAKVLSSAADLVNVGVLPDYVSVSLGRLATCALWAAVIGVPLGLILGSVEVIAEMFEPFVRFLNSVSEIALLPLFLVWFGFTDTTIMVTILYTALMPVIFSTMTGVRNIPGEYRTAVATMGGGTLRVLRDVYIPGAVGSIVVGLRLGIGYGWRALIAAEMVVGGAGLGFMVFDARKYHLLGEIITGMIVIGVLYLIVDRFILAPFEDATLRRWGLERR